LGFPVCIACVLKCDPPAIATISEEVGLLSLLVAL